MSLRPLSAIHLSICNAFNFLTNFLHEKFHLNRVFVTFYFNILHLFWSTLWINDHNNSNNKWRKTIQYAFQLYNFIRSSILYFIFGFSLVWCLCFGFSCLCWCARELRKSIELKKWNKNQMESRSNIYTATQANTGARFHRCTYTRQNAYAAGRKKKKIQKILFTEWECGAIFSSFSFNGSKWNIESDEWKRRIGGKELIINAAFNLQKQRPQQQQCYLRNQQQTGRDKYKSLFKNKWIVMNSA